MGGGGGGGGVRAPPNLEVGGAWGARAFLSRGRIRHARLRDHVVQIMARAFQVRYIHSPRSCTPPLRPLSGNPPKFKVLPAPMHGVGNFVLPMTDR